MINSLTTKGNKTKTAKQQLKETYGLGDALALKICRLSGICSNQPAQNLELDQSETVLKCLRACAILTGAELKSIKLEKIDNLASIKTYRGIRLKKGYPVRGQRTHSNAKTAKKRLR